DRGGALARLAPPAPDGPVLQDDAGRLATRRDVRHAAQPGHQRRTGAVPAGAVAELAARVRAPALEPAVAQPSAGVTRTDRQLLNLLRLPARGGARGGRGASGLLGHGERSEACGRCERDQETVEAPHGTVLVRIARPRKEKALPATRPRPRPAADG